VPIWLLLHTELRIKRIYSQHQKQQHQQQRRGGEVNVDIKNLARKFAAASALNGIPFSIATAADSTATLQSALDWISFPLWIFREDFFVEIPKCLFTSDVNAISEIGFEWLKELSNLQSRAVLYMEVKHMFLVTVHDNNSCAKENITLRAYSFRFKEEAFERKAF